MIAVTPCERKALKKFRQYVKKNAQPHDGSPLAVRIRQTGRQRKSTLAEQVSLPESDAHHLFSPSLLMAVSRSIEDMAGDMGEGELIASFQNFAHFAPHKERYCKLSKKLHTVRVWGEGKAPTGCQNIDFLSGCHPKIARYWMVLFASPDCRAVLLCKQVNKTSKLEDKRFVGFYSFNPYLVQSIRWRFNLLSCGLGKVVDLWEKSFPLPDVRMQEVDAYLKKSPRKAVSRRLSR